MAAEPHCFAAGVVLYPVSDLLELAERSHRFERHYTDSLVGPLPESAALYRERSPAHHVDRSVGTPILIMHGELDAVVPVGQSRVFAQREPPAASLSFRSIRRGPRFPSAREPTRRVSPSWRLLSPRAGSVSVVSDEGIPTILTQRVFCTT